MSTSFDIDNHGQPKGSSDKKRFMTKYVFVHWIGASAPAVKRGKWNARFDDAKKYARSKTALALTKVASCLEDLDLITIITELQALTETMGQAGDSKGGISVEEYLATLAEEQERHAREQEELAAVEKAARDAEIAAARPQEESSESEEEEEEGPELPSAAEAISEVRNAAGIYDWVLLTPMKVLGKS